MRNRWKKIAALTVATLAGLATSARADLWGIAYGDNILVRINPLTAEASFVAFLNGEYSEVDYAGLDFMNGTLYANGIYNPVDDEYGLVSIDTVTFQAVAAALCFKVIEAHSQIILAQKPHE